MGIGRHREGRGDCGDRKTGREEGHIGDRGHREGEGNIGEDRIECREGRTESK